MVPAHVSGGIPAWAHVPPGAPGRGLASGCSSSAPGSSSTARDPFRLRLGDGTYVLNHATGSVDGTSKMGTTSVHGGGGGGDLPRRLRLHRAHQDLQHDDDPRPVLPSPAGRGRRVDQARGVGLPGRGRSRRLGRLGGARRNRGGPFVRRREPHDRRHPLRDVVPERATSPEPDRLRKLLAFSVVVAAGVVASQVTSGDIAKAVLLAVLGASIGVVVGSAIWHSRIELGFIRRFQRDGMPRIQEELHQLAADAVPVPA